jgi:fluoroacetyl-CoA thioesterase
MAGAGRDRSDAPGTDSVIATSPATGVRQRLFIVGRGMSKPVPIGARGQAEETVEFRHTLTAHHSSLPPVYSTPDMIRLMETAAFHALQPYCADGEITVGTSIHVEHRAASGIGARIRAEAIVESFDGRFYTVRVTAHDDLQEIGRGTVGRAVVSVEKFLERIAKPRASQMEPPPGD